MTTTQRGICIIAGVLLVTSAWLAHRYPDPPMEREVAVVKARADKAGWKMANMDISERTGQDGRQYRTYWVTIRSSERIVAKVKEEI